MRLFLNCSRFVCIVSALMFTSFALANQHGTYEVDEKNSSVSFATIKKNYVVEPATLGKISGSVSEGGVANIVVDLSSVDTAVPIRNQRLQELFFETQKHPTIKISARVGLDVLSDVKTYKRTSFPIEVELYGTKKTYNTEVLVINANRKKVVVTTMKPIIISGKAHNIPENNVIELAKTVGAIPISDTVPVNFVLSFIKK